MKSLQDFFRLGVAALIIGLGVGYVLADWSNPGGPPTPPATYNSPQPINVGSDPQAKTGAFTTLAPITAPWIFPTLKLGVGSVITGHALDTTTIDPTAVLDVNGQIRIRGGNTGGGSIAGKVLTGVEDGFGGNGLAEWKLFSAGLTALNEGFGIDLGDYSGAGNAADYHTQTLTNEGIIAVNAISLPNTNKTSVEIQRRVSSYGGVVQNGCTTPGVVTNIDVNGNASCQPVVTSLTAGSGLTSNPISPATGPVTLNINAGSGLFVDGVDNKVKLNVASTLGDGLMINGNNQVQFENNCTSNQTWKYDGTKWVCSDFAFSQSGESVMSLRSGGNLANIYPPDCPASWSTIPAGSSGATYTSNENVGNGKFNKVRVCYRSDRACQAIYLRSSTSVLTCPSGWSSLASGSFQEYAPGGVYLNYINTCYICN